jgi:hypothetical protein
MRGALYRASRARVLSQEVASCCTFAYPTAPPSLTQVRILRLLKLLRLAKGSRALMTVRKKIPLQSNTKTLLSTAIFLFCAIHWVACLFTAQTTFIPKQDILDTWLGKWGYCDVTADGVVVCQSAGRMYAAAICWATLIITATGGADQYPNPDSLIETLCVVR